MHDSPFNVKTMLKAFIFSLFIIVLTVYFQINDRPIKIRDLILTLFFSLIILVCLFFLNYLDRTTKIVFCDVGQGDGAYIRIKNKIDIVIDAGPDRKKIR